VHTQDIRVELSDEPAQRHRLGDVPHARHEHDRLEVVSLPLGQVPDEAWGRPAAPRGEGRGDDEETGM